MGGDPAPGRRTFYPGEKPDDANTGTLYAAMLKQFRAGVTHLTEQGYTPTVRGFIWMQGEQDAKQKESATTYAASLSRLQKRLADNAEVVGETKEAAELVFARRWPSDHRAVVVTYLAK